MFSTCEVLRAKRVYVIIDSVHKLYMLVWSGHAREGSGISSKEKHAL